MSSTSQFPCETARERFRGRLRSRDALRRVAAPERRFGRFGGTKTNRRITEFEEVETVSTIRKEVHHELNAACKRLDDVVTELAGCNALETRARAMSSQAGDCNTAE